MGIVQVQVVPCAVGCARKCYCIQYVGVIQNFFSAVFYFDFFGQFPMCVQELPFEFLAGCLRPIAAFSTFVAAARYSMTYPITNMDLAILISFIGSVCL